MIQITAQRVETSSSYIRWTLCISSFFPERAVVFVSVVYPAFSLTARHFGTPPPSAPLCIGLLTPYSVGLDSG